MSVNEDMVTPTSDSFWEVGKYMRTVKRIDNGHKLCESLRSLIESRAEIEKSYAKQLTSWSKKWNEFLDKGPEYGTTQGAWRSVLEESDQLSDLHVTIAERLMSDVYTSIKRWQKENYSKSMMHFKQTKELEDGFKKAQKEWEKKYNKVCMARKNYHAACRTEKSTANQENNARGDSAVSTDQLRKLQEKLQKNTQAVDQTKKTYNATLNDLNAYNPKYIEDMTEVFNRCQAFERLRMDFFKRTFFDIHRCLDLSVEPKFSRIYTDLHSTISSTDHDRDLKWWSNNHGVDMPMAWPQFIEYSPELQSIAKSKKGQMAGGDGITITSIKHSKDNAFVRNPDPVPVNPPSYNNVAQDTTPPPSVKRASQRQDSYDSKLNPFGGDETSSDEQEYVEADEKLSTVSDDCGSRLSNISEEKTIVAKQTSVKVTAAPRLKKHGLSANSVNKEEDSRVNKENNNDSLNESNDTRQDDRSIDNNSISSMDATTNGSNPFGTDDEFDEDPTVGSNEDEGVMVRVIYNYQKAEEDELDLEIGEVFTRLSEEDDMGWAKGKKDGKIGLYPAHYVEDV